MTTDTLSTDVGLCAEITTLRDVLRDAHETAAMMAANRDVFSGELSRATADRDVTVAALTAATTKPAQVEQERDAAQAQLDRIERIIHGLPRASAIPLIERADDTADNVQRVLAYAAGAASTDTLLAAVGVTIEELTTVYNAGYRDCRAYAANRGNCCERAGIRAVLDRLKIKLFTSEAEVAK